MVRPTVVRYSIVGLAMGINMLCYTDRVCIAVAGPRIRSELGLSQAQLGLAFSIFFLAYATAQAPWGMLADRFGSRGIITAAIFCWSAFTALTGVVWSFFSMLAVRFTFGALEAALSPATAAAFTRWVPVAERSTSFGAYLSSAWERLNLRTTASQPRRRRGENCCDPAACGACLEWLSPALFFGSFTSPGFPPT